MLFRSPINRDELQPGDLVFFNTMRLTFSHVGIYVGDNKFIHSPSKGTSVRVDDLGSLYWDKRFDGARRLDEEVYPRSDVRRRASESFGERSGVGVDADAERCTDARRRGIEEFEIAAHRPRLPLAELAMEMGPRRSRSGRVPPTPVARPRLPDRARSR